ncbi:hypothetical protein GCM10022254_12030 [Actinomadura meridiana]|uniref:Uncharacterized protein n=1 Tax=Actinomadura meridiana TaxID=559626 RepID=A0ABP8BUI9_9ACTN
MTADLIADVLIWAGTAVAVAAALRLPFTRGAAARLHTVAPVTALAAPLLIAGVAVRPWSSWHDVAKLAVIAVLLAATGPATVVTAGQAAERSERSERADRTGAEPGTGHEDPETRVTLRTLPWTMLAPGIGLLAAGLLAGLMPGGPVARAAATFADRDHYAALVLGGHLAHPRPTPADPWTLPGLAGAALTVLLAVAVAFLAVHRRPVRPPLSGLVPVARAAAGRLHALHSGHIGDYAAWLTVGVAVLAVLTTRF